MWSVRVCILRQTRNLSRRQFSATPQNIQAKPRNETDKPRAPNTFSTSLDTRRQSQICIWKFEREQQIAFLLRVLLMFVGLCWYHFWYCISLKLQCNIKGNFDVYCLCGKPEHKASDVTPGQRHPESLRCLTVAGHCAKCELHWNEGLLWVRAAISKMVYLNETLFICFSLGLHWPHQHMAMIRCCSQETWGV